MSEVNSKKAQFAKREVLSKILKENKDELSKLDIKIARAYIQGKSLRDIAKMRGVNLPYVDVGHLIDRIIERNKNPSPKPVIRRDKPTFSDEIGSV